MTYEELKNYCGAYVEADKLYRIESEKYFPTSWDGNRILGQISSVSEEVLINLKNLRENRNFKEDEWHNAVFEFCQARNRIKN